MTRLARIARDLAAVLSPQGGDDWRRFLALAEEVGTRVCRQFADIMVTMLSNLLLYRFAILNCLAGNCLAVALAAALWRSGYLISLFEIDESHLAYAAAGLFAVGWLWVLRLDLDVSIDDGYRGKGNEADYHDRGESQGQWPGEDGAPLYARCQGQRRPPTR